MIRVGPFGDVRGGSKLVRVRFLEAVDRGDMMTLGLRWEATGLAGGLFPVLDADISIRPAGDQATRLALIGSYRPPLGRVGAALNRMVLSQVATATIRALLRGIADALASRDTAVTEQAGTASAPRTPGDPQPARAPAPALDGSWHHAAR